MRVDWFQKFFLICVFLNFQACTNGVTLWQWTYGLILMTQVTDPYIPIYSERKTMSQFPHMKMSWHILSFRTLWLKYQILRFIILLLELKVIWQSTISLSCLVASDFSGLHRPYSGPSLESLTQPPVQAPSYKFLVCWCQTMHCICQSWRKPEHSSSSHFLCEA